MKHILFVLDYYLPHRGGVENVFENIINRLLKKGYKIFVITSKFDSRLKIKEHDGNLNIYRMGRNRNWFMLKGFFFGIRFLFANKDILTIHTSTYGGAIPASLLGFLFKKKVILTVHEIFGKLWYKYKGFWKGLIYHLFERIIFWMSYDIYHCVSVYTLNSLRIYYGIKDSKLRMIYNGIDTDFWDASKVSDKEIKSWREKYGWGDKFVFLYFGHAGKSKGIDYLIKALPELVKENKDCLFVFNLIDSKRTNEVFSYIQAFSKKYSNIQVLNGFEKEDLRVLVASCDCVIAPSLSEGFGSVHSETCAMGKILITSQVAAIPEVVFAKVRFIRAGDSREIIEAVSDVRNGKYQNITEKVFNWDDSVEEVERMYG